MVSRCWGRAQVPTRFGPFRGQPRSAVGDEFSRSLSLSRFFLQARWLLQGIAYPEFMVPVSLGEAKQWFHPRSLEVPAPCPPALTATGAMRCRAGGCYHVLFLFSPYCYKYSSHHVCCCLLAPSACHLHLHPAAGLPSAHPRPSRGLCPQPRPVEPHKHPPAARPEKPGWQPK